MSAEGLDLFDRVPEGIFRPLAARTHRRGNWRLINFLYDRQFGPDAGVAGDQVLRAKVINLIREFYLEHPELMDQDGTELSIRAAMSLNFLIESGWFVQEKLGVREFVYMSPTVAGLLSVLRQFADEGPTDVGGEVGVIFASLKAVAADPANEAAAFRQCAKLTMGLFSRLNATSIRAREVIEQLGKNEHLSEFLESFAKQYIAEIYIADYHELKTRNHPLRHRYAMLELIENLYENPESRAALINSYVSNRTDHRKATELFERDMQRLRRFSQIDEYLERLDNSITRTMRRATSFIGYRLRTRDDIDPLLDRLIDAVNLAEERGVETTVGVTTGPLLEQAILREPTPLRQRVQGQAVNRQPPSPEQRARAMLLELRKIARTIRVDRTQAYLDHATGRGPADSEKLPVTEPNDLVILLALKRMAIINTVPAARRLIPDSVRLATRGFDVELVEGERMDHPCMEAPRFLIKRSNEDV